MERNSASSCRCRRRPDVHSQTAEDRRAGSVGCQVGEGVGSLRTHRRASHRASGAAEEHAGPDRVLEFLHGRAEVAAEVMARPPMRPMTRRIVAWPQA